MKLETLNSSVDVKTNLQMTSIKAELSQDKLHKMWDLLQSPYRDPVASLIREYVSNAFDSHIEAGVDYPVYVTLEEDQSGWFWACEDFGIGISEDRASQIFMKYLNSTKEETNDQIGAFGMGSKSGLGYTDIVHIRTRFDGTEYEYMLHKTSDAPTLSLLSKQPTDARNGTRIKVYLKDNWREQEMFKDKTRRQLAYFDNVTYGGLLTGLDEEFIVYKGENFSYNTTSPYSEFHILIGKVSYPINWESLGVRAIDMPIALNFDIGDLPVIFTREDIRYTDDAIKKVKGKIDTVKQEIVNLATPKDLKTDNLEEYFNLVTGSPYLSFGDKKLFLSRDLSHLVNTGNITYTPNPKIINVIKEHRGTYSTFLDRIFKYTMVCTRMLKNGRNYPFETWGVDGKFSKTTLDSNSYYHQDCILMDAESDPRKNRFICSTGRRHKYLLKDNRKALSLHDYINILQLKKSEKSTWRDQIKWYQKKQDEFFEDFFVFRYSQVEVPDSFEKIVKAHEGRTIVESDHLRFKQFRDTEVEKWRDSNDLHVTGDLKIATLESLKTKDIIWSTRSQDDALRCTYRLIENYKRTCRGVMSPIIISVANKDAGVMELLEKENSNIISLDNWYLSVNKLFDSLVFFEKFGKLVTKFNLKSCYKKPEHIPYMELRKAVSTYNYRIPSEFIEYLVNLHKLQGKKLELKGLNALRSWYKAEQKLDKTADSLGLSAYESALLAIILAPNRPVTKEYQELKKNYLLINQQ